jgi:hypothetical protein
MTGIAAVMCGTFSRSTFATFCETGAPLKAVKLLEPGGCTIRSAPMPRVRSAASFSMPSAKLTMTRMSVTSTATAMIEISVRMGRCTRLETTILFIERGAFLAAS